MVCLVLGGGSAVPICLGGLLRGLHPLLQLPPISTWPHLVVGVGGGAPAHTSAKLHSI